ncbi:MAG: polyprenyl synthetase family protein [Candidatus Saccharimonadales bacterium]
MPAPLDEYKTHINRALEEFFGAIPDKLGLDLSEQSQQAIVMLRDYTMRPAKRIRGALAARAYDCGNGTKIGRAGIQLGVALELLQSYLLAVDDVMDMSNLRRGEPTIHRLYTDTYSPRDADMMAINVGLVAQHFANLALLDSGEEPARITEALGLVHRNITATGFGQMDDLYQRVGRTVREADVIRKHCLKSSYYTFVNPLQAGMALAGRMAPTVLDDAAAFGLPAGIAFQLHNDLLGVFGRTDSMGKPSSDDLQEAKYTLLVHYALVHGNSRQSERLKCVLAGEQLKPADVRSARQIFVQTGAKKFTQEQIVYYVAQAEEALRASGTWGTSFTAELVDLLRYATQKTA